MLSLASVVKDLVPFDVSGENSTLQWSISYDYDIFRHIAFEVALASGAQWLVNLALLLQGHTLVPHERLFKWKDPGLGTCFTWNHKEGSPVENQTERGSGNGFLYRGHRAGVRNGLQVTNSQKYLTNIFTKGCRVRLFENFQMWMYLEQWDYLPWVDTAAFRVYVHNQSDDVTATSNSYTAPAGFSTALALTYTETRKQKVSPPSSRDRDAHRSTP